MRTPYLLKNFIKKNTKLHVHLFFLERGESAFFRMIDGN